MVQLCHILMPHTYLQTKTASDYFTFSEMCINTHISGCPRQTLVLSVWNMFVSFWVDVLLGQTKVYNVDDVLLFCRLSAYQKVLWLYIPVYEMFGVDILHT